MPSPNPRLWERLQGLPESQQLAWLNRWSEALMAGQEPPRLPRQGARRQRPQRRPRADTSRPPVVG